MKKATLVEPSLLAVVEKESPAVFAYYDKNPLSRFTLVDYSMDERPMLMQVESYEYLVSFAKNNSYTLDEVLEPLQVAYNLGLLDLYSRLNKKLIPKVDRMVEWQYILMSIALNNYPLRDFDRYNQLLEADIDSDSVTVMFKTAYMDALYFEAWKQILNQHSSYDELFMKINLFKLKNVKPENMNFSLS